jgi:flagellar basal-body rod protein FlgG
MAITALYASATGMRALDTKLNVLANNLANINTTGFKRSRTNFEDLFYQTKVEPGTQNAAGQQPIPTGIQVGLGTNVSGTQINFTQGSVDVTNQQFDLAIQGDGLFQVKTWEGGQELTVYTRAGNFTRNANGQLVLANSEGSILEPAITIGQDVQDVQINNAGQIMIRQQGQANFTQAGQIQLARFVNPAGLKAIGKNLYMSTDASGDPIVANPTESGLGQIQQGAVELSNVDPVRELVDLIQTQRYFELNSQAIKSADETLQLISNLKR